MLDPIPKTAKTRRGGGVAQVVARLPSKCMVLSSTPQFHQKKKKGYFGTPIIDDSCHLGL
jgi:hypothetical protein